MQRMGGDSDRGLQHEHEKGRALADQLAQAIVPSWVLSGKLRGSQDLL
jgi:hypothetical protein